jgi:hypothetical protein|tara:strand:+ start:95 stop:673 length:579 start_codon:yes stop_codon:yes gene_type:complete
MIHLAELIERGSIITICEFLDVYDELNARKEDYDYLKVYQPDNVPYGNRQQAYPCYETLTLAQIDPEMDAAIRNQVQALFSQKIIEWRCRIRYSLSSEVKECQAFKNTNYGFIHTDDKDFAGVLPFEQSLTGGTSFFSYHWDKVPDVTHGAWPNRMIVYNGKRWHAACQDYSFEKRSVLAIFFSLEGDLKFA